jgi:hypothetical protein
MSEISKIIQTSKRIVFILLLVFVFSSCREQGAEGIKAKNYSLKTKKSLKILLDSLTTRPLFASEIQIWKDNLILFNTKKQKLQFYELKTGNFIRAISLESSGNNGVGLAKSFLVVSKDSIFVISSNQYKVFLINALGKVLESYRLINSSKPNATSAMPDPMPFYHPPVLLNNQLHISSIPDDNPYFDSFYQRENLTTILDLKSKEISYAYSFPDNYRKNIYPTNMNFYCRVYIPHLNSFAYSFLLDEHIRIVSSNYQNEKTFQAIPNNFELFKGLKKRIADAFEDSKIGNTLPSFVSLQHNPFEKKTYRILQIPKTDEKGNLRKDKYKLILLGFDENFNKIKEITFNEKSPHNPLHLFFTPEGMWIQRSTENEDELVYDLVEFVAE